MVVEDHVELLFPPEKHHFSQPSIQDATVKGGCPYSDYTTVIIWCRSGDFAPKTVKVLCNFFCSTRVGSRLGVSDSRHNVGMPHFFQNGYLPQCRGRHTLVPIGVEPDSLQSDDVPQDLVVRLVHHPIRTFPHLQQQTIDIASSETRRTGRCSGLTTHRHLLCSLVSVEAH